MIFLLTGAPGSGKTLKTIDLVTSRPDIDSRPVYFSGLKGISDDSWQEIEDPKLWYELPTGSIIILDEAQTLFRPSKRFGEPPRYISELETHRHHGYDIYLTTQSPSQIDAHVRRLVGRHEHLTRAFNLNGARVMMLDGEVINIDRPQPAVIKSRYNYPKKIFEKYQSAEIHTNKFSWRSKEIRKFYLILIIPFFVVFLLYFTVYKALSPSDSSGVDTSADSELSVPRLDGFAVNKSRVFPEFEDPFSGCERIWLSDYVEFSEHSSYRLGCTTHSAEAVYDPDVETNDFPSRVIYPDQIALAGYVIERVGFRRYALIHDGRVVNVF